MVHIHFRSDTQDLPLLLTPLKEAGYVLHVSFVRLSVCLSARFLKSYDMDPGIFK